MHIMVSIHISIVWYFNMVLRMKMINIDGASFSSNHSLFTKFLLLLDVLLLLLRCVFFIHLFYTLRMAIILWHGFQTKTNCDTGISLFEKSAEYITESMYTLVSLGIEWIILLRNYWACVLALHIYIIWRIKWIHWQKVKVHSIHTVYIYMYKKEINKVI